MPADHDTRYSRQLLLPEIGAEGQRRLGEASVLVVGCGALGTVIAELLVRAGVGRMRIVDRDVVELSNLQRQLLFDEEDARQTLPKAEAAAARLARINAAVPVEGIVADVTPRNVEALLDGVSVVLDGTDNLETRYVLNDACVKHGLPWVYGGAVRTEGTTMSIVPGRGPCLRCVFPEPPPPGTMPTCDTVGVLGAAPTLIGALQATEAIKLVVGVESGVGRLLSIDLWNGSYARVAVEREPACPACGLGRYDFLSAEGVAWVTSLCGRHAVQITPAREADVDFERLQRSLEAVGAVRYNGFVLTCVLDRHELVVFPGGRALVKGTTDEAEARALYARYIGT